MNQSVQPASSASEWLLHMLHSEPHIWDVVTAFEPRLGYLGVSPKIEWIIALSWAILDALYIPFLVSLDPIIQPFLNLSNDNRSELHSWAYLATLALAMYKTKGAWSSGGCIAADLRGGSGETVQGLLCTLGVVWHSFGALALGLFVFLAVIGEGSEQHKDSRSQGPLRTLLICALALAAAAVCFYPLGYSFA